MLLKDPASKKTDLENQAPTTDRQLIEPEDDIVAEENIDVKVESRQRAEDAYLIFNPVLYTRGLQSDAFYLILSGKVNVCSGNEGFMITQSAFNYLGQDALTRDDYTPDFSAKVIGKARILKITR